MLKQWAISIGLAAGLAMSAAAIAGGDDCPGKQTSADKAVPSAEKSAAQSQSAPSDKDKN